MTDNTKGSADGDPRFVAQTHFIEHENFNNPDILAHENLQDQINGGQLRYTKELNQAGVVRGAIRIVNETNVKEVYLSRDDGWSKTIRRGALWVYGSGLIFLKRGSPLKDGKTFDDLKKAVCGFEENDWCYHLTNISHEMDWMAHKYIAYSHQKYGAIFDNTTSFGFDTHAIPPTFPDWIDAEVYGGFEGLMAIFGEKL